MASANAPATADAVSPAQNATTPAASKPKLHGRAFYESIGSPKFVVAPMVDQSEFAWRMLTRSFMAPTENEKLLAYTPMFHARLFEETAKYRDTHFQAIQPAPAAKKGEPEPPIDTTSWLDGNPDIDRPLFVQFCANEPSHLLAAAKLAAPYCDAVDLNLGCPQGIARKGHYGAFLQEDQELIYRLINTLYENLPIPVTAKIRCLDSKEETLAYAKNVLAAGASIVTLHGRRREQKGHLTGLADWSYIRYLRDNLPPETVIFANGNILQRADVDKCLEVTGADAVMSAEGNLSDPSIFAELPAPTIKTREYWRGRDGKGGYRVDAVFRRYMDIIYKYVARDIPAPVRRPLFVVGDDQGWLEQAKAEEEPEEEGPAKKKRKKDTAGGSKPKTCSDPNLLAMRPHLFHLLRHFVATNTDIRDALAKARPGDVPAFEHVLELVERRVAEGLIEYEKTDGKSVEEPAAAGQPEASTNGNGAAADGKAEVALDTESSVAIVKKCKRPWWIAQPIIRPLPKEALAKGALSLSKKDKKKMEEELEKTGKAQDNGSGSEEYGLPKPDGPDGIKEPKMDDKQKGLVSDELVCG